MNITSLVVFALLAQAAQASVDAKSRAQALLREGTQLYEEGGYPDALTKFEQAYALYPSPKLLFNMAKTARALGRPVDAIEAFERFLAEATDVPPEMVESAKRSVAELSLNVGSLMIDCSTAGAEISVDGKRIGLAPIMKLLRVVPGNHQVTATHPSALPAVENVVVAAGTAQTVGLRLRPFAQAAVAAPIMPAYPMPAPAPTFPAQGAYPAAPTFAVQGAYPATAPAAAGRGWWLGRKWTWVAAGSAVVFAGGAIVAGLAMESKFDELKKSCGKAAGVNWTGCGSSDYSSLDARKNTANVFWGLTAAAAVTTGVLFYFEGRPVTVVPMAGEARGMIAEVRY